MDKKVLKEYQNLEKKAEEIEKQRSELRAQIVEELQKEKVKKMESEYGTFTVASRVTYTYSEAIKKLNEKVKLAKVKEERKGIAKPTKTNYLVYSNGKKD